MDRDCGWVQLLPEQADEVLGRGRAVLTDAPAEVRPDDPTSRPALGNRGQLDAGVGLWSGRLDPLQIDADAGQLAPGPYRIRFEENEQVLAIRVLEWQPHEDEREGRGQAFIESVDGELPAVLLELGGH